jgi:hypothetical protein
MGPSLSALKGREGNRVTTKKPLLWRYFAVGPNGMA